MKQFILLSLLFTLVSCHLLFHDHDEYEVVEPYIAPTQFTPGDTVLVDTVFMYDSSITIPGGVVFQFAAEGRIQISNGTLTIGEGCSFEMGSLHSISVREKGKILLNGTAEKPVLFTVDSTDNSGSSYYGSACIVIESSADTGNLIQYVEIKDAKYGIECSVPDGVTIQHSTIENCRGVPLKLYNGAALNIEGNTFSDTGVSIFLDGSDLTALASDNSLTGVITVNKGTLREGVVPPYTYELRDDLIIAGGNVRFSAGTVFHEKYTAGTIIVRDSGSVHFEGTATDSIYFDYSMNSQGWGEVAEVLIDSTADTGNIFEYVQFSFCGTAIKTKVPNSLSVSNCTFFFCTSYGLDLDSASLTELSNCSFEKTSDAILAGKENLTKIDTSIDLKYSSIHLYNGLERFGTIPVTSYYCSSFIVEGDSVSDEPLIIPAGSSFFPRSTLNASFPTITVQDGGVLQVRGTKEDPVRFASFESRWNQAGITIKSSAGSGSFIDYALIEGAGVGIKLFENELAVSNTIITSYDTAAIVVDTPSLFTEWDNVGFDSSQITFW